jgi:hypothetical protein
MATVTGRDPATQKLGVLHVEPVVVMPNSNKLLDLGGATAVAAAASVIDENVTPRAELP